MPRRSSVVFSLGMMIAGSLAGCSSAVRKPHLLDPGTAPYQRSNAVQFDPYPQNDVAPAIVGGRPRDYAIPPNEVTRARQFYQSSPWGVTPTPKPLY